VVAPQIAGTFYRQEKNLETKSYINTRRDSGCGRIGLLFRQSSQATGGTTGQVFCLGFHDGSTAKGYHFSAKKQPE
jgi:hypothetical protein